MGCFAVGKEAHSTLLDWHEPGQQARRSQAVCTLKLANRPHIAQGRWPQHQLVAARRKLTNWLLA